MKIHGVFTLPKGRFIPHRSESTMLAGVAPSPFTEVSPHTVVMGFLARKQFYNHPYNVVFADVFRSLNDEI